MIQAENDELMLKVKSLSERVWGKHITASSIDQWLGNFVGRVASVELERTAALYMLSQFMYFGNREMRELLRSMYRDLVKVPIMMALRRSLSDTLDDAVLAIAFRDELKATRFLGVGNPSESGVHLLYYFRQENQLGKKYFISTHELFARDRRSFGHTLRSPEVKRYIFIDDLCGSGDQAVDYSENLVEELKTLRPDVRVSYYSLFGLTDGLERIRATTVFDDADAVFELDASFRAVSGTSRYFSAPPQGVTRTFVETMCTAYGRDIESKHPLGYKNGQLLLGLFHNTPDNTLPIIWGESVGWHPIFRRYPKLYGWGNSV